MCSYTITNVWDEEEFTFTGTFEEIYNYFKPEEDDLEEILLNHDKDRAIKLLLQYLSCTKIEELLQLTNKLYDNGDAYKRTR